MSLIHLVEDCLLRILDNLAVRDILSLRRTCKQMQSLTSNPSVWRSALRRLSDDLPVPHPYGWLVADRPRTELEMLVSKMASLENTWQSPEPMPRRSHRIHVPDSPTQPPIYLMSFLPGGRFLLSATADGEISLWDLGPLGQDLTDSVPLSISSRDPNSIVVCCDARYESIGSSDILVKVIHHPVQGSRVAIWRVTPNRQDRDVLQSSIHPFSVSNYADRTFHSALHTGLLAVASETRVHFTEIDGSEAPATLVLHPLLLGPGDSSKIIDVQLLSRELVLVSSDVSIGVYAIHAQAVADQSPAAPLWFTLLNPREQGIPRSIWFDNGFSRFQNTLVLSGTWPLRTREYVFTVVADSACIVFSWPLPDNPDHAPRSAVPTQQSFPIHRSAAHVCIGATGRRVVWIQEGGTDDPEWLDNLGDGEPAIPSPVLHLGRGIESLRQNAVRASSLPLMPRSPESLVTLVAFDEASGRVGFVNESGIMVVLEL